MRALIVVLPLLFFLVGCDITPVRLLATDYRIESSDSDHVYVVNKSRKEVVVGDQVVAYQIHGGHLLILRMVAYSIDCGVGDERTIVTNYTKNQEFWIIDLARNIELGPLDEQEYYETTDGLGFEKINLLTPADYRPNTTAFLENRASCEQGAGDAD